LARQKEKGRRQKAQGKSEVKVEVKTEVKRHLTKGISIIELLNPETLEPWNFETFLLPDQ